MNIRLPFAAFLALLPLFVFCQDDPLTPEVVTAMPGDTAKVKAWIDLSNAAMRENFDLARSYGDSAANLATRIGYEKGIAQGHRQIGVATYYGGQLDASILHYQIALDYYRKTGDEINQAKILNNIGLVKRSQARHDEAMQFFFQALEIKERYTDTSSMAYSYNTIGETYAIMTDYEKAEVFFLKALEGFRAVGNTFMVNSMLLNLGAFFRDREDNAKALEYILASKAYFEANGPKRELARIQYILGAVYFDEGDLPASERAFLQAKVHYDSLGAAMQSVGCILNLSRVAREKGEPEQAKQLALDGLQKARAIGTNEQIARAHNILYGLYKNEGNYREAMNYLEAYHEVQDSISNEQSNRTITELQEKYQSEVKERQLAELKATNQVNELNLKKQREQSRLLLLFAILVVVIALLLFNQYRAKKRHNETIQASLDEKEVLLREIHHRVKNNLQFISSLLSLQSRHVTDPQTLQVLREGNHRINSMALVHQKLYQEHNLTGVEMPSYITNLLDSLIHAYKIDRTKVTVHADIDDINLDIDTAMPIGLILNELITNAFKYAFKDREKGSLHVVLREEGGRLRLGIQDDGPGLPPDLRLEDSPQFGFELVRSLAGQMKADIHVENRQGVHITLHIAKYQKV